MLNETTAERESGTRMFLDIPTAASLAGFSIRHFRRIVEEDRIPTMRIGRKFFILTADFYTWKDGKGSERCS